MSLNKEILHPESIDPARLQSVADWLQANVRPVAHVLAGGSSPEKDAPQFEIREYQLEAWVKLEDRRNAGGKRALGNLATGLGKTFVAAVDVARYQEWGAAQSPPLYPRMLYVSHQNDINTQAEKTFRSVMPDAGYATFDPRRHEMPEADITFATIQSLYRNLDRLDPNYYQYIVYDETHHLEAETFKKVRDHFRPLFEHGITATVGRMDGKDIQKYFGKPLYQKSLPEGIAEGHLKDVDYHIVFDASIKDKLKDGFDPKTLKDIKDLFKDKPPRAAIARNIEEEIEKLGLVDPKMIVFCEDIAEADAMAELLGGVAYHSDTKDRQSKLDDFRAGRNLRMTTRDMFNEGVDIPDAEVIVFLRGTGSNTIFEQQLGRGLRKSAGKPKVYVLDFVANVERIAKVRELSEDIQRRAREIGQAGVTEEGVILQNREVEASAGLRIHTAHGDFDFDRLAIDLLERWGALQKSLGRELSKLDNEALIVLALSIKPNGPLGGREIRKLSGEGLFVSEPTIQSRFGSLVAFQSACGFEQKRRILNPTKLSNEDIVALALKLEPDRPLSHTDIRQLSKNGDFISTTSVIGRFGSIGAFQEACGFEFRDLAKLSNEDLVTLARKLKPDGPLGNAEIRQLSKNGTFVSITFISHRFGSLVAFQSACGFEQIETVSDLVKLSDQELIALALKLKPDGPLSGLSINKLSKQRLFVSKDTIARRFGSVAAFQKACGFNQPRELPDPATLSNEDLVTLARKLKPDGQLTRSEVDKLCKQHLFVSYRTLRRRFGSHKAFQEICGTNNSSGQAAQ